MKPGSGKEIPTRFLRFWDAIKTIFPCPTSYQIATNQHHTHTPDEALPPPATPFQAERGGTPTCHPCQAPPRQDQGIRAR
jgi:hypothetical protein